MIISKYGFSLKCIMIVFLTRRLVLTFSFSLKRKSAKLEMCAHLRCSHSHLCTTNNPFCCTYVLKTALFFLDTFFAKYNISYVIVYGTLLGAVRNGTMIPWTRDLDIALFDKKTLYDNQLRNELYEEGYLLFEVIIFGKKRIFLDKTVSVLCLGIWYDTSLYTFGISWCNSTSYRNYHSFVTKINSSIIGLYRLI